MDDKKLKFGVGVLVIAAIGIGIILTFLFGAVPRVLTSEFRLLVVFPKANGISTNTPVLLRGCEIGRVVDIQLRNDDVLVTLGIDSRYQPMLNRRLIPKIGTGSFITGDAKLEFSEATQQQLLDIHGDVPAEFLTARYTDDEYLNGDNDTNPFEVIFNLEDEIKATLESVRKAGDSIDSVGGTVNQLVGDTRDVVERTDQRIGGIAEDARGALVEFQGAMRDIRAIVGDEEMRASLTQALAELPELLNEAQATLQSSQKTFESFEKVGARFEEVGVVAEDAVKNVDQTVDSVRETMESVQAGVKSAERTIRNLETITEPIAANSEELVAQVLTDLRSLDRTLGEIETFGKALNNSDGTVRRLLEDDHIYWQIRRTIENIETASARIRPILDDVRIFSDKIARDPRQLGVRGAIGQRPSGMGLK